MSRSVSPSGSSSGSESESEQEARRSKKRRREKEASRKDSKRKKRGKDKKERSGKDKVRRKEKGRKQRKEDADSDRAERKRRKEEKAKKTDSVAVRDTFTPIADRLWASYLECEPGGATPLAQGCTLVPPIISLHHKAVARQWQLCLRLDSHVRQGRALRSWKAWRNAYRNIEKACCELMQGAVTNQYGAHGVLRESDLNAKRAEFQAWAIETQNVDIEILGKVRLHQIRVMCMPEF